MNKVLLFICLGAVAGNLDGAEADDSLKPLTRIEALNYLAREPILETRFCRDMLVVDALTSLEVLNRLLEEVRRAADSLECTHSAASRMLSEEDSKLMLQSQVICRKQQKALEVIRKTQPEDDKGRALSILNDVLNDDSKITDATPLEALTKRVSVIGGFLKESMDGSPQSKRLNERWKHDLWALQTLIDLQSQTKL